MRAQHGHGRLEPAGKSAGPAGQRRSKICGSNCRPETCSSRARGGPWGFHFRTTLTCFVSPQGGSTESPRGTIHMRPPAGF
eukprot:2782996-Pyramimonas_sp.AAC.1